MRYDITFLVGGEQHVERIDAPDAPAAAQAIHEAHGRSAEQFELIAVHLIDEIDPTAAVDRLAGDANEVS